MIYIYIATAVVAGLILGFAFLCIVWLTGKITRDIRDRSIELMSSYDVVLEKKKNELESLQLSDNKTTSENTQPEDNDLLLTRTGSDDINSVINVTEKVATADYCSRTFGDDYKNIRLAFTHDPQTIASLIGSEDMQSDGKATSLLNQLDYTTVYSVSTFSENEQYDLMKSVLDKDGLDLLNEFGLSHARFSMIDFYDFLKAKAALEPQKIRIKVSEADARRQYPDWMSVHKDDDILEGFEIETGSELYDYSIRKREII